MNMCIYRFRYYRDQGSSELSDKGTGSGRVRSDWSVVEMLTFVTVPVFQFSSITKTLKIGDITWWSSGSRLQTDL